MTTVSAPTTLTGTYAVEPAHSKIRFVARHSIITEVRGSFNDFEGSGYFDAENPTNSNVRLTIQAASIDTRNPRRDAHLRSNSFFDIENHPEITFESTEVEQVDTGTYRVTGDLTIKGVTKPVTVDFEYAGSAVHPYGDERVGFKGTTTVNRKEWGMNGTAAFEAGGVLISQKVALAFEMTARRTSHQWE